MKFVCRDCEAFMIFQQMEKPGEDSLGITYECPKCKARFSMVTNPGETQMVQALGVNLGGKAEAAKPFGLVQERLNAEGAPRQKSEAGRCPFADAVVSEETARAPHVRWTKEASQRLQNVPEFVRLMAKEMIERMAQERGKNCVDESLMDEAKDRFM